MAWNRQTSHVIDTVLLVCYLLGRVTSSSAVSCTGSISLESYEALESLYNSTAGKYWKWDQQQPTSTVWQFPSSLAAPCFNKWQGLTCGLLNLSSTSCEITAINLANYSLTGTIPSQVGNLGNLKNLSLGENSLVGPIPSEFGALANLEVLSFPANCLEGSIPSELGNLLKLDVLNINLNRLDGSIPPELGNLLNLQILYLGRNPFTGAIPTELGQLVLLTELFLYDNYLVGCIPSELGNLIKLESLVLALNPLTCTIPSQLGKLEQLTQLFLYENLLTGTVPSQLGNLENLEELGVYSSYISGTIPSELGNLVKLVEWDTNSNSLEGPIPSQLGNLANVQILFLFENSLTGPIPSELGNLLNLIELSAYRNWLSGSIPSELGNLKNLELLALFINTLDGVIPPELGQVTTMQSLVLSNNNLFGPFELNTFNSPALIELNVSSNSLSGTIAISGNNISLSKLLVLDMSNNRFSGTLADSFFELPSLQSIVLSQNCFSGTLPSTICMNENISNVILDLLTANCGGVNISPFQGFVLRRYMLGTIPLCVWNSSSIRTLHLIGNGLTGPVAELSAESQLSVLALGSNQLTGTIPVTFQRHSFLQLDLSVNRFSGTLDGDLFVNRTATVYDLSVNRLSGQIPNSLYGTFSANTINVLKGNLFGCRQDNVPASDISHASYSCGSLDLEYSLLAWFVGILIACLALALIYSLGKDLADKYAWLIRSGPFTEILWGPSICLVVSLMGLAGFVVIKMVAGNLASTHAVQYWWTSTAAFARNWLIGLFIFLLLAASSTTFTLTMMRLAREEVSWDTVCVPTLAVVVRRVGVHFVNAVVVTSVNAVYILVAVGRINNVALLAVQATLGIFKLLWTAVAIPLLISRAITESTSQMSHWIFMTLFTFLGAPFASSFCESSSGFLNVLARPSSIRFTYTLPVIYYGANCDLEEPCSFTYVWSSLTEQHSILPPWLYSYQCSSAVIMTYAPVLLLSYLVSGILFPTATFVAMTFRLEVCLARLPVSAFKFASVDGSRVHDLLTNDRVSRMGRKAVVKYMLNLAVMLTFGLAVPLLSIAVICDIVFNLAMELILLERVERICENCNITGNQRQEYWNSFRLDIVDVTQCCYIVLGFVSLFWSLFVFDWIGDVYGLFSGGLAMLVPLLLPALIAVVLFRRNREQRVLSRQKSDDLELTEIRNPVNMPQVTNDDFSRTRRDYGSS
jgi:Leucine-rich repeat (LRR) protein